MRIDVQNRRVGRISPAIAVCLTLLSAGCSQYGRSPFPDRAIVGPATPMQQKLEQLMPPGKTVSVAVYEFPDLTGQHRFTPGLTYGDFSKAVTQGGGTLLIDVLRSAGGGTWFKIVERARIENLLRERKLVQDTYTAMTPPPKNPKTFVKPILPAITFADYIFEGGITGYDRVIMTGGLGASYLGIQGNVNYQKDVVNVTLRLVDVLSGEVIRSINTSKTIYSINLTASLTRFVSVSDLLELNVGISAAEPALLAVREAIELAVYQHLKECIDTPTWCVAKRHSPSRYRPPIRPPAPVGLRGSQQA